MSNAVLACAAQSAESLLQERAGRLVDREVIICLSSMVATLARGSCSVVHAGDLQSLAEQAQELCSPGLDYEEAATQAGWIEAAGGIWIFPDCDETYDTAEAACDANDIDAYEREIYEHWAVSTWLAEKLIAAGERVDNDFANLNVWARTTTGQAISMDGVIRDICGELHAA